MGSLTTFLSLSHSLTFSLYFFSSFLFFYFVQYLDNENPNQPIYLYINCAGGSVISGLAIYDAIQHIKSEVVTVNLGLAASMASFLLASGSRGRRLALPHSRVMIHQPAGGAQGQAEDIRVEASQIMRIRNNIVSQYAIMTGQTKERILKDLDRLVFCQ
jgi:ATP-dependent Clp endopeptidase proteolytic subunit ClpP